MGKAECLTPKAIANGIKAKGLQKLKWYCQMCRKQCRDENGFKCHCQSEGHQRQMQVFAINPDGCVDGFSEDFEEEFLEHLKWSHRSSRVAATVVWNEYIANRDHMHMNCTKWATLTDFVQYLGRAGKCKVDETPKGWFIRFIDRERETLRGTSKNKRDRADEERLREQIERAGKNSKPEHEQPEPEKTELVKREGEKITFALGSSKLKPRAEGLPLLHNSNSNVRSSEISVFGDGEDDATIPSKKVKKDSNGEHGNIDVLAQIMRESEQGKEKVNRKDYWLCEGFVVKVMSKNLADYYKQKGVVQRVIDKYVGEVEMLDNKHVLKVDQVELETVIPQIGGVVRIVNGAYRGSEGRLVSIDTAHFSATVRIENGFFDGRIITADYGDICKLSM